MPGKSGEYYVKVAKKAGLDVEPGCEGSHKKIYGIPKPEERGRPFMVVPMHKSLSPGVEHAIVKWLRAMGVSVAGIIGLLLLLSGQGG